MLAFEAATSPPKRVRVRVSVRVNSLMAGEDDVLHTPWLHRLLLLLTSCTRGAKPTNPNCVVASSSSSSSRCLLHWRCCCCCWWWCIGSSDLHNCCCLKREVLSVSIIQIQLIPRYVENDWRLPLITWIKLILQKKSKPHNQKFFASKLSS